MQIKREKIKYINNDIQNGIVVDWAKAKKYFKQLNVPADVWTPLHIDFNKSDWNIELSKRSRGKSTNNILFGLILWQMYGCDISYIRTTDEELKLVFVRKMFRVINQYGYISAITNEEYNQVYYHNKAFYLCYVDEEGNRLNIQKEPFMTVLSLTMSEDAKSTLNMPLCVWIIFDEFIKDDYRLDEFIALCQLVSSIKRDRWIIKVNMASNLIDLYSPYIDELGIREVLEDMKNGTRSYMSAPNGARLYVEYIEDIATVKDTKLLAEVKERNRLTKIMFGFSNPKLNSIVGGGWQVNNYAHLPKRQEEEERKILYRDIYLYFRNKIICLELSYSDVLGYYVNCREYFGIPRYNSIKFKLSEPLSPYEFYGVGLVNNRFHIKLWGLYVQHRFFYSNNTIGKAVESYIKEYRQDRLYVRR